jgi:hypothetical protein
VYAVIGRLRLKPGRDQEALATFRTLPPSSSASMSARSSDTLHSVQSQTREPRTQIISKRLTSRLDHGLVVCRSAVVGADDELRVVIDMTSLYGSPQDADRSDA